MDSLLGSLETTVGVFSGSVKDISGRMTWGAKRAGQGVLTRGRIFRLSGTIERVSTRDSTERDSVLDSSRGSGRGPNRGVETMTGVDRIRGAGVNLLKGVGPAAGLTD